MLITKSKFEFRQSVCHVLFQADSVILNGFNNTESKQITVTKHNVGYRTSMVLNSDLQAINTTDEQNIDYHFETLELLINYLYQEMNEYRSEYTDTMVLEESNLVHYISEDDETLDVFYDNRIQ